MLNRSPSLVVGGRAVRGVVVCLIVPTFLTWAGGCAETQLTCPPDLREVEGNCLPKPEPCAAVTKTVPVGCAFDQPLLPPGPIAYLPWKLTVEPTEPIVSNDEFSAKLKGVAQFSRTIANMGQTLLAEYLAGIGDPELRYPGFRRVALLDFKATVRVRDGAEGGDVVLYLAAPEKTCTYDERGQTGPDPELIFPTCSTDADCIGLGGEPNPKNPCLPYFPLTTSDDCSVGGECESLGATGLDSPCEAVGFCVTAALDVAIAEDVGLYVAEESGAVLFGWADTDGEWPEIFTTGPDRGAYNPESMSEGLDQGIRLSGFRLLVPNWPLPLRGLPSDHFELRFECIMGVNSRSADGVGGVGAFLSPSPDGALLSCPIQTR
jgi:hypothetical protein